MNKALFSLITLVLFVGSVSAAMPQLISSQNSSQNTATTGVLVTGTQATTVAGKAVIAVPVTTDSVQAVPINSSSTTVVNPQSIKAIEVNGKGLVEMPSTGVVESTSSEKMIQSVSVSIMEVQPTIISGGTQSSSGGQSVVIEKMPVPEASEASVAPEVKITSSNVAATTNLTVVVREREMFVQSSQATTTEQAIPVKILPATAQSVVVAQTGATPTSVSSITLSIEDNKAVYKVEAAKQATLLWVMPVTMPITSTVNAVSGIVVSSTPWWSFLITG